MMRILKGLWLLAMGTVIAAAQIPTVDIYTTPSSDGTNVYVTGVMQVSSSNFQVCSAQGQCATIIHTYKQTVTITSPSGRTGSCSFNIQQPSTEQFNGQCEAALSINGETGDFTAQDIQTAYCSWLAGFFLNSATNPYFKVGLQQVQFIWDPTQNPVYGCVYDNNCGASPSYCGGSTFAVAENPYKPACYNFVSRRYLFVKVGTSLYWWQLPIPDMKSR